jgi:hypothetical protein
LTGFTTDYVNLIVTNLRDRYKTGFPILKELVQNADDAGATTLVFGYSEGLGDAADHDLLKGPALWVLNDGKFLASDQEAIRSFGLNDKAADVGSIGKFGLGMKSLFHLCESFFYLASDGRDEFCEILNPWIRDRRSDPMHVRWEKISAADRAELRRIVEAQPEFGAAHSWFMLWIPLRRRIHLAASTGNLPAIVDRFPGDVGGEDLDFFTEEKVDERIGYLLPLLRSLRQVRSGGMRGHGSFEVRLKMAANSSRLDHVTESMQLDGSVLDESGRREYLRFLVLQHAPSPDPVFNALMGADAWPKSMALGSDGSHIQVRDKARPEGAVLIGCADNRPGALTVEWAVFLPTEEVRYSYKVPIENSSKEFHIVLHGQFFVDAGRRGIAEMEVLNDEPKAPSKAMAQHVLMRSWNQALAQQVLLPLIPRVLGTMVKNWNLRDQEVMGLTRALSECAAMGDGPRTGFYATFRAFICGRDGWARVLLPDGAAWTELQQARCGTLLPIPAPPVTTPERPWSALPGLRQIADAIFIDDAAPALLNFQPSWPMELFGLILQSITPQTLATTVELSYLVRFLEPQRDTLLRSGDMQAVLIKSLRRCIADISLDKLRQNRGLVRSLMALVSLDRVFAVGTRDASARGAVSDDLYKRLLSCETYAMPMLADLCEHQTSAKYATTDLVAWLEAIAFTDQDPGGGDDLESRLGLAEEVIECAGAISEQASLISSVRRLPVLRLLPLRGQVSQAVSLNALLDAQTSRLLFKATTVTDPAGFVPQLAAALPETRPLLIRSRLASMIEDLEHPAIHIPASTNAAAIISAVGASDLAPKLGSHQTRRRLLESVASADLSDVAAVRGMRYLLHGEPAGYATEDVLWKDPSSQNSVWIKLWRMTAEKTWEVLPSSMCEVLPDTRLEKLNIRVVDEASVLARLRACKDMSRVDGAEFTVAELDTVLSTVGDEEVWRRLPLHRDVSGTFLTADEHCYVGHEPPLPSGLPTNVRFIALSAHAGHTQRQKQWLIPWSASAAASTVLNSPSPARHCAYLLDLLQSSRLRDGNAPALWRSVAWLPLKTGNAISIDSLIVLNGLAAEIDALARKCDYAFGGPESLSDAVLAHPGAASLLSQIASGTDALPVLGQLMSEAGLSGGAALVRDYRMRELSLSALAALRSLPAWEIVQKAVVSTSIEDVEHNLIGELGRQLSSEEAECCLRELAERGRSSTERRLAASVLREWAQSGPIAELVKRLAALSLPSQSGDWKPATELVAGVYGVEPSWVLDQLAAQALRGLVIQNDSPPEEQIESRPSDTHAWNGESLVEALRTAFDDLAEGSARASVGAVIGLFGHLAEPLAREWLGEIDYEDYLAKLDWRDPGYEEGGERKVAWMGGKTLEQALRTVKFTVCVDAGQAVEVRTILGGKRRVSLLPVAQSETLLAGGFWWQTGNGVIVTLRSPRSLLDCDSDEQRKILQRTAEEMLSALYNQKHASLDALWALFSKADQVTLRVARSLIVDGLPQLLRALPGVTKLPKIKAALARLDAVRRLLASSQVAERKSERPRVAFEEAKAELSALVETDADVQATILEGIKQRVAHNQYELSSIAFELFQNADDAVGELQRLRDQEGRAPFDVSDIGRFAVGLGDNLLRFIHWGRPINYTGRHGQADSDFGNDLERMLMLGASSKPDDDSVTGKFGLGFKSVLLGTATPRVCSGDLRFEVIAGCLPQRWEVSPETDVFLREQQAQTRGSLRATLVELPLMPEVGEADIVARFFAHHGLLTVFAHNIRQVQVGATQSIWSPQIVCRCPAGVVEVGITSLPSAGGNTYERILAFKCREGTAAMRLSLKGFLPFDENVDHPVPAVWVTTPTRGHAAHGVAITAKFAIDTGRATLASGKTAEHNQRLALSLASQSAELILQLQNLAEQDWVSLKQQLGCSSVESPAALWVSFWKTLLGDAPEESSADDLKLVEKFAAHALRHVVAKRPEIPNGLPGHLAGLVRLDELRLSINTARFSQVIPAIETWPSFQRYCAHSRWCSSDVLDWLRRSQTMENDAGIEEFGYASVRGALKDGRLCEEDVLGLESVLAAWPKGLEVDYTWRLKFQDLELLTAGGSWRRASHVLRDPPSDDLMERFAPDAALLAPAYATHKAIWQHVNSLLPSWLATKEKSQRAVCCWLIRHLHSPALERVRRDSAGTWIETLQFDHSALQGLTPGEQRYLLTVLGLLIEEDDPTEEPPPLLVDLRTIHRWWSAKRILMARKLQASLWPAHANPQDLHTDVVDRQAWMALFCLALFQRYGRSTNEQHRGFLEFLHRQGWWDTICNVDPDQGAEQWMLILKRYSEDRLVDGLFEQWMDSYHRVYRIARWLEEYVHIARTLDHRNETEFAAWLSPASDPVLHGSGIEAPALSRMLRMGKHLLIRELLRVKVLSSPRLFKFAYMPGRALLDLMAQLGAPDLETGEDIYSVLVSELGEEGATFQGDFDLPLQLLATEPGMLDKVAAWAEENPDDEAALLAEEDES